MLNFHTSPRLAAACRSPPLAVSRVQSSAPFKAFDFNRLSTYYQHRRPDKLMNPSAARTMIDHFRAQETAAQYSEIARQYRSQNQPHHWVLYAALVIAAILVIRWYRRSRAS
jgi:hypothetical protein